MTNAARKRGRPLSVGLSRYDKEVLGLVYMWMTWEQNYTKSFDQLVHDARDAIACSNACLYPQADRKTLPNRLKRLHAKVAAGPVKYGFPEWVTRLPITGRRVVRPKQSGASYARRRRAVRDLMAEVERVRKD
jgi:hypothetical protein